MTIKKPADVVERYITEVSDLLLYDEEKKVIALTELRHDILDALGDDKRPISVVFGPPSEVAANLSASYDWGTKSASWFVRFLAFVIDSAILGGILLFFVAIPLNETLLVRPSDIERISWGILLGFLLGFPALLFSLIYFIFLERVYGTTFGKRILHLLVLDESGIRITWGQAITRNITKVHFLGQFLFIDVLIGLLSKKTRGRHQRVMDYVSGTIVVQK